MQKEITLKLDPDDIFDDELILKKLIKKSRINPHRIKSFRLQKRSIDARGRNVVYVCRYVIFVDEIDHPVEQKTNYKNTSKSKRIIIVGAGPAGYFAALRCIEKGLQPIILERGKGVRERRRDLRSIQQEGTVNPNSNYCFGEGGAGTYSDGKLYTRSKKRGSIINVLQTLVEHGASQDILIDAHPHIGSNKLPKIVQRIRQTILEYGGEILFNHRVVDFVLSKGKILGVIDQNQKEQRGEAVILATGHSARDIYRICDRHNIRMEAKPFALGVRIEHPQALIDEIQYGLRERSVNLPASSYSLTCQANGRGVFSFCMCPGGLVVPAATSPGEIVVNGMSLSRRDSAFANSGTVVAVELEDLQRYASHGVFQSMRFQQEVEQKMFALGEGTQKAPAQKLIDFVNGKISKEMGDCSYIPGIFSAPLHEELPSFIYDRLRLGILQFAKKMKGYYTNEAQVIGTESRTSAPIRIPRDKNTRMHIEISGLFPCGEGAGYAGGILSAAMDGQNVVDSIYDWL